MNSDDLFLDLGFPALREQFGGNVTYHYSNGTTVELVAVVSEEEQRDAREQHHQTTEETLFCSFDREAIGETLKIGDYMEMDNSKWSFKEVSTRTSTITTIKFTRIELVESGGRNNGL